LDYAKNNGVTALGIASFSGNLKILEMLHKAGADINALSKVGVNPLYLSNQTKQSIMCEISNLKQSQCAFKGP